VEFVKLGRFYLDFVLAKTYHGAAEECGIGHETLRHVVGEYKRRTGEEPDRKPYDPHEGTLLDLEAFFWRHTETLRVRDDPNAPLPKDLGAATKAVLGRDRRPAEEFISEIEETLAARPTVAARAQRVADLLRLLHETFADSEIRYDRRRAPKKPRKPKSEDEPKAKGQPAEEDPAGTGEPRGSEDEPPPGDELPDDGSQRGG
jgi:hypothetical protein